MEVKAYLMCNATVSFDARDKRNAMEIAKRIITEGLWVENEDGTTEMYPIHQIFKVKITPDECAKTSTSSLDDCGLADYTNYGEWPDVTMPPKEPLEVPKARDLRFSPTIASTTVQGSEGDTT